MTAPNRPTRSIPRPAAAPARPATERRAVAPPAPAKQPPKTTAVQRPTTSQPVKQSGVQKSGAVRPATEKRSAVRPTASVARGTTSRLKAGTGAHATGRTTAPKKKSTALIVGGAVGGVALLLIIGFAMMGGSTPARERSAAAPPKKGVEKQPVDVSELIATGTAKCEEGYALIQTCQTQMEKAEQSDDEKKALKEKLTRGVKLIDEGMHMLERANEKAGENRADPKREWGMARKMANNYIANLGK